ncbi:MAG: HD domain-containing protein [candidate division Zixibacteria bacterium]|nr:HD domain-containing protein [candidate division Zixibacteria bacterium]
MLITENRQTGKNIREFLPIFLETLRIDSILDFDLYIRIASEPVLYRSKNLPFTESTCKKLLDSKVTRLFIRPTEKRLYQRYIEQNLNTILADEKVPEPKKAGILYETSKSLVKDVLANPTLGENIKRSKDLVGNTVEYVLRGREAFLNLLKITSFDYYTYTHSVNVCTFTVALAQKIGIKDYKRLNELGVGALLHDVGKTKIPERIIRKKSALSPAEFAVMKKHPGIGNQLLKESNLLVEDSHIPVIQHHERVDGSGYPRGLSGRQIHDYGRIIAIADVFDALTTERVYQSAMGTYPALKLMYETKDHFDERYLREFTILMGPENYQAV